MRIVYVSTLISEAKMNYIIENSSAKPLQSVQRYHRLICEGLSENNVSVSTISAIPMSSKISKKKIWLSKNEMANGVKYQYLPFINLPILRQLCFLIFTIFFVLKEILLKKDTIFICDILNTTISATTLFLSKLFGNKCLAIVTDLPTDMTSSQKLSVFINKTLETHYDSYIFITEYMNKVINKYNKPYIVLEGVCEEFREKNNVPITDKYIMYAGGLYEKYGLKELVEGFQKAKLKDVKLYIFGSGDLEDYLKNLNDKNIIYFGTLKNEEILKYESTASLLVNPRFSNEEYTKYSFPSKNMEYMSSGIPVLTTKLLGIPKEYYDYTFTISKENANGIKEKLEEIFQMPKDKLSEFGSKSRDFVLKKKNKTIQSKKIVDLCQRKTKEEKTSKIFNIYGFIVLFLTILLSRNTLITNNLMGFYKSFLFSIVLYLPLILNYLIKKKYQKKSLLFIFLIILMLISIILKRDFQLYNFSIFIYLVLSYIYIQTFSVKKIFKWFIYIMIFLAVYSLISVYLVMPILVQEVGLNNLKTSMFAFENVGETPFLNLVFSYPVLIKNYIRNFGIFTEPGFYQFYLLLALLILILVKNLFSQKVTVFLSLIIILTIITTFSTAAYICLFLIFLYLVIKYIKNFKKIITNKLGLILTFTGLILMGFIIYLFLTNDRLIDMTIMIISKLNLQNSSTNVRLNSLIYTLELSFLNPILGTPLKEVLNNSVTITNTNISFMAIYGLLAGILLLIIEYRLINKFTFNKKIVLFGLIILLLTVNNHLFIGVHSFWLLMLIGIKEDENESFMAC